MGEYVTASKTLKNSGFIVKDHPRVLAIELNRIKYTFVEDFEKDAISEFDIRQKFSEYGNVINVFLEKNKETRELLNYCYISFETE